MWYAVAGAIWLWGAWLAVRAIVTGRTSQGTLAWVLVLLFVPPIAIPMYFMFGDRRLEGYLRARRNGRRRIDRVAKEAIESIRAFDAQPADRTLTGLSTLAQYPWTKGNRCDVFNSADDMYDDLLAAIDGATKYILMQFYIYRDDTIGKALRERVCVAAKRGVRVYMMFDELGCAGLSKSYFEEYRAAGCNVSGFRTVPKRRRLLRLNFRNHRKLVVVDGSLAYFGGMNIGDEYRGKGENQERWRDTHAVASGPCVTTAQLVFAEDWNWAQGSVPEQIEWKYQGNEYLSDALPKLHAKSNVAAMLMFPSGPTDEREPGVLLFLQLISRAMSRLWIATPYLVCEDSIAQALLLAKARGVDIRILVPLKADSAVTQLAAESFIRDFVAAGIQVYQYADGFSHQKVLVSDNAASIGSANLDHRSMKLNFEVTGIIDDASFADAVAAMLKQDLKFAVNVPKDWWDKRTKWQRFKIRVARLAAPVL